MSARSFILVLVWTASLALHAADPAECDGRLYHRVSQGVARLVPNVLTVDMVEQMADSAAPFDPTQRYAPNPRNLAAREFLRTSFARLSSEEWGRIRGELTQIARRARGLQEISEQASRQTQEVLKVTPLKTYPVYEPSILDWRLARNGHSYFLNRNRTVNRYEAFDLGSAKSIWHDDGLLNDAVSLGLDAQGDAIVTQAFVYHADKGARVVLIQTRLRDHRESQKEFTADVGEISKIVSSDRGIEVFAFANGRLYGFADEPVEFPQARGQKVVKSTTDALGNPVVLLLGEQPSTFYRVARFDGKTWSFIDGKPIQGGMDDKDAFTLRGLRDGRMFQTWFNHHDQSLNYQFEGGEPVAIVKQGGVVVSTDVLELQDGRVFVAALTWTNDIELRIFQAGNPAFTFRRPVRENARVRLFERQGRFYAIAAQKDELEIYEPLSGSEPLLRQGGLVLRSHFSLQTVRDGEILVLSPMNGLDSQLYSLFTRSR